MKQDCLVLLLWVGKNATTHGQASKGILVPGIKFLQQLSNSDDNIHWKVLDFLPGEYCWLESDHLKMVSSPPTNDVKIETLQIDRKCPLKVLYPDV